MHLLCNIDLVLDRLFHVFLIVDWTELKDAIARRHGEKLEEAIQKAKSSEFESSLQSLIKEAEELLSQLRRLRRFAHEILEMQPSTISEIHSYKYPKPLAYDIMKATYTLLGEQGKHVEVN